MIYQVAAPSRLLVPVAFAAAMLCSAGPLRDAIAFVVRNGAGLASAAPMPAKYQVAKSMSNINFPSEGSIARTKARTQWWQCIRCCDFPTLDPTCQLTLPGHRLKYQYLCLPNPLRALSREVAIPVGKLMVEVGGGIGRWRQRAAAPT